MDFSNLKKEVAAVLQDVPNHSLPLFKFREMFEKRYRRSVSSSDLYRMKDVVIINETSTGVGVVTGGRIISLSLDWDIRADEGVDIFCKIHPPLKSGLESSRLGWAEKEVGVSLPNVEIEFKRLSQNIGIVLDTHSGGFPLFSFLDCYGAQFGSIGRVDDGSGVPLEHLIASVHGVEISFAENGMKRVQWKVKKEYEPSFLQVPLGSQLGQLSRELVDLLKTFPRCSIPFSKLIPAYHHHFGRQCRVADYGHLTLSALLQTLPMTIQVIGEGPSRVITLAHRAQMKRFATDVLRVLKQQPGIKKQLLLDDFSQAFTVTFPMRTFCPEDYGLCFFADLVAELVDNFSMVTLVVDENNDQMLAIPKREQSPHEIQKTRIFSAEVVELLSHSIRWEMPFSKFIPSYHHHFGRQCRVSDFGFSKLAELFDAISDTVISENPHLGIESNPEDKIIRLTPRQQVKVVGEQIRGVVQRRAVKELVTPLNELEDIFLSEYGFALRVVLCGATDLRDLISHFLCPWVKLDGDYILLSETKDIQCQASSFVCTMSGDEFMTAFSEASINNNVLEDVEVVEKELSRMGMNSEYPDNLKRKIRHFGQEITELLEDSGGYLLVQNIETVYAQKYGRELVPSKFGYTSLMSLLQGIPDIATLRGKFRTKRVLVLNKGTNSGSRTNTADSRGPNHTYNNHGGYHNLYGQKGSSNFNQNGHHKGNQDQGPWNGGVSHLNVCLPPQQSGAPPPPLFSPLLSSPTFRARDTNVFNFEQPSPLSPPIYDMWMGESGAQGSPPISPPIVWAYHPICYPPPGSPGSPNLLISGFSYAPWSSQQTQPMMNPSCFELDMLHQQPQ